MTKIDVTQVLRELDGEAVELASTRCLECGSTLEGQIFTLRLACTTALVAQFRGEELPEGEHVKRYHLALKIHAKDDVDLKAADIVLIKKVVAKMRGPLIVGQVCEMLDPDPEE